MYANDPVVLGWSSAGLQQLLNVCSACGVEHDIKYNARRRVVLICKTKGDKCVKFPVFKLSGNLLEICMKVKYLGHFITEEMTDNADIYRQCHKMYAQGNSLAYKFGMCTERFACLKHFVHRSTLPTCGHTIKTPASRSCRQLTMMPWGCSWNNPGGAVRARCLFLLESAHFTLLSEI